MDTFPSSSGSAYSVADKLSTQSAQSISVASALKVWRDGGHRELPFGCGPRSRRVITVAVATAYDCRPWFLSNFGAPFAGPPLHTALLRFLLALALLARECA